MAARKINCDQANTKEECKYYVAANKERLQSSKSHLAGLILFGLTLIIFGLSDPCDKSWFGSLTVMICSNIMASSKYPKETTLDKVFYWIINGSYGAIAFLGVCGMVGVFGVKEGGIFLANAGIYNGDAVCNVKVLFVFMGVLIGLEFLAWVTSGVIDNIHKSTSVQASS